jgi:hypothetical protein
VCHCVQNCAVCTTALWSLMQFTPRAGALSCVCVHVQALVGFNCTNLGQTLEGSGRHVVASCSPLSCPLLYSTSADDVRDRLCDSTSADDVRDRLCDSTSAADVRDRLCDSTSAADVQDRLASASPCLVFTLVHQPACENASARTHTHSWCVVCVSRACPSLKVSCSHHVWLWLWGLGAA